MNTLSIERVPNWQDALLEHEWPPWQWTPSRGDRTPLLTFQVLIANNSNINSNDIDHSIHSSYGFYFFNIPIWVSLLAFTIGSTFVALPTAIAVYYIVVQPQHEDSLVQVSAKGARRRRRVGTTWAAHLLVWTILVPAWIVFPARFLDESVTRVDHLLTRFCILVITPTVSLFRVTEALYGFAPAYATRSLGAYCFYFCAPLPIHHDPVTLEPVRGSVLGGPHLLGYLHRLLLTGMFQSLFVADGIASSNVFPTYGQGPASAPDHYFHWTSLYDLQILKDSLLMAILFQCYLSTFGKALQWVTAVTTGGCEAQKLFGMSSLFTGFDAMGFGPFKSHELLV